MTQTLCGLGMLHWDLLEGYCVVHHVKWKRLNPNEFAAMVFYWFTRNMSGEDIENFAREIEKPPPGVNPTKGAWSDEALLANFQNAMRSV